ncbi:hypothetical protein [Streptomyces sp. NPDC048442]|uniref:hypothetical protein n=1 Tax=Streptomyces sp. NPDC048442 TaxID=3154823 RepID=UPI00342642E6
MAASRHFRTDQDPAEVRQEIEADIAAARRAQRDLQAAGSHSTGERMRQGADEYLDELAEFDAGTWTPRHA